MHYSDFMRPKNKGSYPSKFTWTLLITLNVGVYKRLGKGVPSTASTVGGDPSIKEQKTDGIYMIQKFSHDYDWAEENYKNT